MANLEFVEARSGPNGPFEVTQLINSFLGALAHPWEAIRDELKTLPLREAEARGWPRVTKERPTDEDPSSLGDLLRRLRNCVAHGNIEFLPDGRGEIQALRLWNVDTHRNRRTWGAIVTVGNVRQLLTLFVDP
jgi:HEPN pEK499 p136